MFSVGKEGIRLSPWISLAPILIDMIRMDTLRPINFHWYRTDWISPGFDWKRSSSLLIGMAWFFLDFVGIDNITHYLSLIVPLNLEIVKF